MAYLLDEWHNLMSVFQFIHPSYTYNHEQIFFGAAGHLSTPIAIFRPGAAIMDEYRPSSASYKT